MYISNEHSNFIKSIKKEKISIILWRCLIIIVFLFLWEMLARMNLINTFIFSSPSLVLKTIINLVKNGNLFQHLSITVYEVIASFAISSAIGLLVSSFLWFNKKLEKILDPYLTILNSLPKVALGPLIIIWVGASINSIIFMSLLISTFVTIINIYNSFDNTDKNFITLMKSLKASNIQIFKYVVLPSNFLTIINSLKINISMNLIGVIMGELLVSRKGIGYLIMYGSQVFNIDLVISGVIMLGILSYLMYYSINQIELKISNKQK